MRGETGSVRMGAARIEEELAGLDRDFPLPGGDAEMACLRRKLPGLLWACGRIASRCPRDGRVLCLECESGYVEILLKRHYGFRSIVGLSSRLSPEMIRRLAAFGIPLLDWGMAEGPIPEAAGGAAGIVMPRVSEQMGPGLLHVLKECRRALATAGVLILGTSNVVEFVGWAASGRGHRTTWFRDGSRMFGTERLRQDRRGEPSERELAVLLGEAGYLIDEARLVRDALRMSARLGIGPWSRMGWHMYFVARPG